MWRTYTGGKLLEEWQGECQSSDGSFPEEWVASITKAKNVGRESIANEGLSFIDLGGQEKITLKEVIETNPKAFLGKRHTEVYGSKLAVLVKVLDASERLTIQTHPEKNTAKRLFQSEFGKTEAWMILGGRKVNDCDPYLLMGFKPGITKEKWRQLFEEQDIDGMIASLHQVPLKKDDVFLIEGGVPHAIGEGCFIIEIQEPTDLTLRVEKTTPNGMGIPDLACHQGLGFDNMMDCFCYDSYSYEEMINRSKILPKTIQEGKGGHEIELIGTSSTDRFKMNRIEVKGVFERQRSESFFIVIVVKGHGKLQWSDQEIAIHQSDQIFIPASVERTVWENLGYTELTVVLCFPPDVEANSGNCQENL